MNYISLSPLTEFAERDAVAKKRQCGNLKPNAGSGLVFKRAKDVKMDMNGSSIFSLVLSMKLQLLTEALLMY